VKKFEEMNLDRELIETLKGIHITDPTEVQQEAIPAALAGEDIIVRAKTGTGKTYSFLIPIMQNVVASSEPEALVIAPTRELALQIADSANKINRRRINVAVIYGGASINVQAQKLRRGVGIVIGTPGRIIDMIKRRELNINAVKYVVLDEADTMLDMGFIEDVEYILSQTPRSKQTLLFSATMPEKIISISRRYMRNARVMTIGEEENITTEKIKHMYFITRREQKLAAMLAYIEHYNPSKAIIFAHTKYEANNLFHTLQKRGIDVVLLHGGLTQASRERSMGIFRGRAKFLIATNVAARGIDIKDVSDIINFDVPDDPYVYVHRVGRSARMGKEGRAFTIATSNQAELIKDIEYVAKIRMERQHLNTEKFSREVMDRGNFRHGFRNEGGRGFQRREGGFRGRPFERRGGGHGRPNRYGKQFDRGW
jgi:ATP-dependent RNA helicase DeaD